MVSSLMSLPVDRVPFQTHGIMKEDGVYLPSITTIPYLIKT